MILRPIEREVTARKTGFISISQPTHSWISGQLARAWKRSFLGRVPEAELFTAAALHDIGYLDWEQHPVWNPQTGLPFSFMELPCEMHLKLWEKSYEYVLGLSRYAALFVNKHTTHLCSLHGSAPDGGQKALNEQFLHLSREQQLALIESLQEQSCFAPCLTPEAIARQRDLIAAWDSLSLFICGAFGDQTELSAIPMETGNATLRLEFHSHDPEVITVSPWPFQERLVTLRWDGRHMPRPFENQADLDRCFFQLNPVILQATLQPLM